MYNRTLASAYSVVRLLVTEFRWLNKQGVESSKGFVVQFTGRFSAEYREHGRVLEVEIEPGLSGGNPAICYSATSFRSWSSNLAEQQRASGNFERGIIFQGLVPVADSAT
jgi:hypothetical protein